MSFSFVISVAARPIVNSIYPPRASGLTKLFMFRHVDIIAEVQSGENLCWAAQCVFLRVLSAIC